MSARIFLCICFAALIAVGGGGWAAAADYVAAGETVMVVNPKQDSSGDNVRSAISREKALETARSLFPDILAGKDLQAELADYRMPGRRNWQIMWSSSGPGPFGTPEHIFIVLDSQTGDLLNANFSLGAQKPDDGIGPIGREEALQKAVEFVKKMRPQEFARTRLEEDRYPGYSGPPGTMRQTYEFFWQRYENGVRVEGDGISAGVGALSGRVQTYNFTWHSDLEFPAPGGALEAGALAGRLLDNPGLYLGYAARQGATAGADGLPEALLFYQLNSVTPYFDSHTGEPVDGAGNIIPAGEAGKFTSLPPPAAGAAGADPPEAAKTKVSQEQAQRAAEDFFRKIGVTGAIVRSGGGSGGNSLFQDEYWVYSMEDDLAGGGAPRRMRQVMVGTSTGEVGQYYNNDFREAMSSVPAGGGPALTRGEALAKARDFAKLVNPGRFSRTVLSNAMSIPNLKLAGEYNTNFQFTRLVNGLPFQGEGIEVSVDAASGEIRRYSCKWHRAYFPGPAGALKAEEAKKLFLEKVPLELVYFFPWEEGDRSAAPRLVYRFAGTAGDRGLDAVSGSPVIVDWTGARPAAQDTTALPREHWAYRPLALLHESGLLPAGEDFNPDGAVTRRDAARVLMGAINRYYGDSSEDKPAFSDIGRDDRDYRTLQTAVRLGVLAGGGEFKPGEPLSRETMAAWLVRALGYEEVAKMPVKIELSVKDADQVDAALCNHVAIACGLGLMAGDENGFFRPQDNLTWAELAALALKAAPALSERFSRW